jgi:hypothetical protein
MYNTIKITRLIKNYQHFKYNLKLYVNCPAVYIVSLFILIRQNFHLTANAHQHDLVAGSR